MNKKIVLFMLQLVFIHGMIISQTYPLDSTFGVNGRTIVDIPCMNFSRHHIANQSDGKILLATSTVNSGNGNDYDFCLFRFNTDGSVDNSFGSQGLVLTDLGSSEDYACDVTIQPDDKILVVGTTGRLIDRDFAMARYTADGTPDQSVGNNGIVKTSILYDDAFYSVAFQADGKIVAGGAGNSKGYIFRFLADGSLDNSFGNSGKISLQYGFSTMVRAITILDDGSILAAGQIGGDGADGFVAKMLNDGSADSTFGTGGKYIVNDGNQEYINSMICQRDGKILLGGAYGHMSGSDPTFEFLIIRLLPDGTPDNTFNNSGKLTFNFGLNNNFVECYSLIQNSSDDIFAIGSTNDFQLTNSNVAIAKITSSGIPDVTYGNNGKVISDFGSLYDKGQGALIDLNDKLIVSGIYGENSNPIVCRYQTSVSVNAENHPGINNAFKLYPNPCKDYVSIELSPKHEKVIDIALYDLLGKEMFKYTPGEFPYPGIEIPTHFLTEGIYLMKINTGDMILSKKLIRKK